MTISPLDGRLCRLFPNYIYRNDVLSVSKAIKQNKLGYKFTEQHQKLRELILIYGLSDASELLSMLSEFVQEKYKHFNPLQQRDLKATR